jgi:hypothetical protein
VFDEAWAYVSERARRLYDELVPVPTRKISCRLIVTYAGFEGEGDMLHQLYQRGLKLPQVGANLYAGDGLLMAWHHDLIAPWQTEAWLADMRRTLRPNQYLRMCENRFVTSESSFVDMPAWDKIVDPKIVGFAHSDRGLPIWVGVDASVKHDSTAICAITFDSKAQLVRLIAHYIFQPTLEEPLNFEQTIERTLLDLNQRFQLRKVVFDPYQMQATADALLLSGRLNTLLTRLHRKRTAAETAERLSAWEAEFKALKDERDLLAVELLDTYPALAAKLIDLFSRLAAFDGRISQLLSARPSSVKDTLLAPELEARGLSRFTRAEPSITAQVQLFDLNTTKQIWPVPVPRDMSIFAPLPYNPRYSGEWHKYQEEEANACRAESERVNAHYEQMAKERAAREHQEDLERWKQLGGAGK